MLTKEELELSKKYAVKILRQYKMNDSEQTVTNRLMNLNKDLQEQLGIYHKLNSVLKDKNKDASSSAAKSKERSLCDKARRPDLKIRNF